MRKFTFKIAILLSSFWVFTHANAQFYCTSPTNGSTASITGTLGTNRVTVNFTNTASKPMGYGFDISSGINGFQADGTVCATPTAGSCVGASQTPYPYGANYKWGTPTGLGTKVCTLTVANQSVSSCININGKGTTRTWSNIRLYLTINGGNSSQVWTQVGNYILAPITCINAANGISIYVDEKGQFNGAAENYINTTNCFEGCTPNTRTLCSHLTMGFYELTPIAPGIAPTVATTSCLNYSGVSSTPSNGTSPYTYAWSPAASLSSSTVANPIVNSAVTSQVYTVTVTDANSCSVTASSAAITTVANPSGGSISTVGYCSSAGSASVSISGVSNVTDYVWSLPSGLTGSSTTSSITVNGSTAGTYTVTVTPRNVASGVTCTGTAVTGTVNVVANPSGGSISTVSYCSSAGSASVSISGVSNVTDYVWSLPSGLTGSSTTSSITVNGSTAGTYTVTATPRNVASGVTCTGTAVTGTVNVVANPSGGSIATVSYCKSTGGATVSVSGVSNVTDYVWSLPSGLSGSSTSSSISVTGTMVGTYTISVTPRNVASGVTCTGSQITGTVNVIAEPSGGSIATVNYCVSSGGATVAVSGVSNVTDYVWSLPSGLTGSSTTASINVSGSTAGSYTVTVTPRNTVSGVTCTDGDITGTVNVIDLPTANAGVAVPDICQGGTTIALSGSVGGSATGGTWSDGGAGGSFSPSANDLNATYTPTGTYSGTVTLTLTTTGMSPCTAVNDSKTVDVNSNTGIAGAAGTTECSSASAVNNSTKLFLYDTDCDRIATVSSSNNLGNVTACVTVSSSPQSYTSGTVNTQCTTSSTPPQHYGRRSFDISAVNSSNAGTVVLYYTASDFSNLKNDAATDDTCLGRLTYNSSTGCYGNVCAMVYHGGAGTPTNHTVQEIVTIGSVCPDGSGNYPMTVNMTGFSGIYCYACNPGNIPLFVNYLYFKATPINNEYIKLDWATANEHYNAGFEIQRSSDAVNFEKIGWVDGNGNSTQVNNYIFNDKTADFNTVYYYRLKQVDYSGQIDYSNIVSAIIYTDTRFSVSDFMPNRIEGNTSLNIFAYSERKVDISIYDVLGQKIMSVEKQLPKGTSKFTFDFSQFSSGTYSAAISSEGDFVNRKFIIVR